MIVILSNTPTYMVKKISRQNAVKHWMYLGKKTNVLNRLTKILSHEATASDYAKTLYRLSQEKRSSFVRWIDDISLGGVVPQEWFFSVPVVKNTYSSNLFLYICYFLVFKEAIHNQTKIDLVIVDSPALGRLLKKYFPKEVAWAKVNYFFESLFYFDVFLRSSYRYAKFVWEVIRKYFAAKMILGSRIKTLLKGKENLVLIRNFITGDFSDTHNGIFEKHFFPGLDDYLASHGYTPVFLPVTVQVPKYRDFFQRVKKSKKIIIFAEEFLKLWDYLYIFLTPIRALGCQITPINFSGYDLMPLVREEYFSNLTEFGLMYASLLSRLGRRFQENNLCPMGIINWNENQAFEKGLISGFRKIFPDIKIIGSQPFIAPTNHLSIMPSRQDKLLGLVPNKTLVLGPIGKGVAREFIDDLKIAYSPAFRYTDTLNTYERDKKNNNLLVLFGYGLQNSLHTLRTLIQANHKLPSFDHVFIKLHPAGYFNEKRLVRELNQSLPQNYSFINGQLEKYLSTIAIGICGATGAAVELVVRGIPVIMIGDTHALTMNYLSYKEDSAIWRLCFSEDEVIEALNQFNQTLSTQPEKLLEKAGEFRRAFFAEPNSQYWENYLLNS